jgi:hypothetical protein
MLSPGGNSGVDAASPSKYRTSLDARMSIDGLKVLEDPLVVQLITENELMLMEIEDLRRRISLQDKEIAALRHQSSTEEVANIHEVESMLLEHDRQVEGIREKDEKKVALLRPILETLARLQFEMGYYTKERFISDGGDSHPQEISSRPTTPLSRCASSSHSHQPHTLPEANARYEQLYHLIASYQATPSFMSSPYDGLVLDALNHIIALSKTMNALVHASAEQSHAAAVTDVAAVESTPPPVTEEQRTRRPSFWETLTRK